MKTIEIELFGGTQKIIVTLNGKGGGSVESDLHPDSEILGSDEATEDTDEAYWREDGGVDALESMILAHACAGIDVTSAAYVEGIETTIEAMANNL